MVIEELLLMCYLASMDGKSSILLKIPIKKKKNKKNISLAGIKGIVIAEDISFDGTEVYIVKFPIDKIREVFDR